MLRVKVGGTDTLTGGAFIYRDNILWRLNRELRKQLYGDDAFEYQNSKQRNAQLPLFVKLLLVSRWGEVKMFHNKEEVFVPPDGHAWSIVGRPALYERLVFAAILQLDNQRFAVTHIRFLHKKNCLVVPRLFYRKTVFLQQQFRKLTQLPQLRGQKGLDGGVFVIFISQTLRMQSANHFLRNCW